jgi:hypothetical protein
VNGAAGRRLSRFLAAGAGMAAAEGIGQSVCLRVLCVLEAGMSDESEGERAH